MMALLRDRPRQAQEVAALLGVDTAAVRRQLEALRSDGLVDRTSSVEGVGRPKMRYHLTEAGRETFPRQYGPLLEALMVAVQETSGVDALDDYMRLAALHLAPPARPDASPKRHLADLVRFYNELGFEASSRRSGDDRSILTQRNCPVWRAARQNPAAVCQCLDEGMIRAAVPGSTVRLLATMAEGAALCRHEIRLPER